MSFTWFPSGATPDYLRMHIWERPPKTPQDVQAEYGDKFLSIELGGGNVVSVVEEHNTVTNRRVNTKIHHLPHADIIFDTGSKIECPELNAKRIELGFSLKRVGPYHHPETILAQHSDWWMASAHYMSPEKGNFCENVNALKREVGDTNFIYMCADSGGAQTKFRTANYVDPAHVIKVHNACAHTGMALDLATRRDKFTDKDFQCLPWVQRKHNRIFVAGMKAGAKEREEKGLPPLRLLNVIHGMTGDDFRFWYDVVNDKENFSGWAVSLDSDIEDYCIFRGCAVLWEKGVREEQVHLFGVSGPNMIPVMAWLGRFFPNLTSDSSSWIEGGRRRTYFYNERGMGKLEDLQLVASENDRHNGKDKREDQFGIPESRIPAKDGDPLPCQCEFCSMMKTFGALRASEMTYTALVAHNIFMIKEIVAYWNKCATEADNLEDYLKKIEVAFRETDGVQNRTSNRIKDMIRYVEKAMKDGPEAADEDKTFGSINERALRGMAKIQRKTNRPPLFETAKDRLSKIYRDKDGLIQGLSVPGSNMELLGYHLTDDEMGDLLAKYYGFDKDQVIAQLNKKAE